MFSWSISSSAKYYFMAAIDCGIKEPGAALRFQIQML